MLFWGLSPGSLVLDTKPCERDSVLLDRLAFLAIGVTPALGPWSLDKGHHSGEGKMQVSETYSPDRTVNKKQYCTWGRSMGGQRSVLFYKTYGIRWQSSHHTAIYFSSSGFLEGKPAGHTDYRLQTSSTR